MFSPLPLKTDFGEHLLTPFTSLFSPKGFSLTSPLAANLFEDFAVKDGHLSFDNLDSVAPTNKKKRKFDGLLATDFGSLSDSLPPAQKLCLTPFPDLTYTRPVVQYGRIRAMEAEVRELEQSIAEMEAAIEQAESQSAVMDEENRDLWATFSYLQRCLRLGHQARTKVAPPRRAPSHGSRRRPAHAVGRSRLADTFATPANATSQGATALHTPRQPDAAPQALPRLALPEPDLASLATSFLSPGTEELFAAACNMFLSPGKLMFTPGTSGGGAGPPAGCGGTFSGGLLPAMSPLGLPVIGHKKLFAEELDLLAAGGDLSGCPPCALPELEDELFAGLEF
ncbi:hypothetical protein ACKKBG_A17110 [Auxenochlorella protothecoides x Auxenochlorella symbiontica]|uniref:Uncharacterized protein n=1 Tax=Auxenochlorella protothecoides TaxID=3075 RepID=A0A1D1ZUD4_AUXPR